MDLSARQKNTSCNDDMITPAPKRSTKYQMSYGQIRYLMKRLRVQRSIVNSSKEDHQSTVEYAIENFVS